MAWQDDLQRALAQRSRAGFQALWTERAWKARGEGAHRDLSAKALRVYAFKVVATDTGRTVEVRELVGPERLLARRGGGHAQDDQTRHHRAWH